MDLYNVAYAYLLGYWYCWTLVFRQKGVIWKYHCQSVSQDHLFSKTADKIFMKSNINSWFLKDKKVIQSRKKTYFGEKAWNILKSRTFWDWCAIFGFTWSTIVVFMILQKPHVINLSQGINEDAIDQSDCTIF